MYDLTDFNEFTPSNMSENPCIVIIAKRGSGKTWVTRDLMYHLRDIPAGVVISATEEVNHFFRDFVPPAYIYSKYSQRIMKEIFKRQERRVQMNEERRAAGKKPKDIRMFLVMDDCLADSKVWKNDEYIQKLMLNGRHYHLTFILTLQYCKGIPPAIRSNFDYIFLLGDENTNNKKNIFNEYGGIFATYKMFNDVFSEMTHNYGMMVLDLRRRSSKLMEKVFRYRATDPGRFQMGSSKYNTVGHLNYKPKQPPSVSITF